MQLEVTSKTYFGRGRVKRQRVSVSCPPKSSAKVPEWDVAL